MNNELKIKDIYNKYSKEFTEKITTLKNYDKSYDELSSFIHDNNKILDLACGPGNISKYLKEKNKTIKITGVDFSENLLKTAKINIPDAILINESLKTFELNEIFDIIIFGFGLPFIDLIDFNNLLIKIKKLLKNNGILYISFMDGNKSGFEKTSFTTDDVLYIYYHPKEKIIDMLENNNFRIIKEYNFDYNEMDGSITRDIVLIMKGGESSALFSS